MKIVNILQLTLNLALLGRFLFRLSQEDCSKLSYTNYSNDLEFELNLLKFVQFAQATDFVFSKGAFFTIFIQYCSRIFLAGLFLGSQTSAQTLYILVITWTIADSVRYAFYLTKNSIISTLRYNLFIVLYPLGVSHELICLYNFQQINNWSNELLQYMSYFDGTCLIVGLPVLYKLLLGNRRRYYRKLREASKQKQN